MHSKTCILGIDVGSVAVSAALINSRQQLVQSAYRFHEGNITAQLSAILSILNHRNLAMLILSNSLGSMRKT